MAGRPSKLRVSAPPASDRFQQVLALYPRAELSFDVVSETAEQCVIQARLARWPSDPAPAVAHAASQNQGDVGWTRAFEDARQAAADRVCQNLWIPSLLLAGPSVAEQRKTQHAAFAWLLGKARSDDTWRVERREIYQYLATAAFAHADDGLREKAKSRMDSLLAAERPDREKLEKFVRIQSVLVERMQKRIDELPAGGERG